MTRVQALAPVPAGSELKPVLGHFGLPVLGSGAAYIHNPLALWRKQYREQGPVSWMGAFGQRMVTLLGPDACAVALVNADKAFANGPGWNFYIGKFFDRGLMLLDFDEHKTHRRILQEAFTAARLSRYLEALHPAIKAGLAQWAPSPDFRAYPAVKTLTLDLATDIFMGG